jgi:hypothetical protein
MNSRLRTCLLVALGVVGWAVFSPAEADAQRVTVYRPMVSQYLQGGYGGYGGYSYQPQYYGGYSYPPQYYSTYSSGYSSSYAPSYGNAWNGYPGSYPVYGYNRGYGTPAYNYSNPTYSYPAYGYRTSYRGSFFSY